MKKKVDELAFAFHKSTQRGGNIEELWRKAAQLENERKNMEVKISQMIKTTDTNVRESMDRISQLEQV
jgi:hypothetical protein